MPSTRQVQTRRHPQRPVERIARGAPSFSAEKGGGRTGMLMDDHRAKHPPSPTLRCANSGAPAVRHRCHQASLGDPIRRGRGRRTIHSSFHRSREPSNRCRISWNSRGNNHSGAASRKNADFHFILPIEAMVFPPIAHNPHLRSLHRSFRDSQNVHDYQPPCRPASALV